MTVDIQGTSSGTFLKQKCVRAQHRQSPAALDFEEIEARTLNIAMHIQMNTAGGIQSRAAGYRWIGNLRFTLGAVQQILQGKTHHARIAVLPCQHAEATVQDSSGSIQYLQRVSCRDDTIFTWSVGYCLLHCR